MSEPSIFEEIGREINEHSVVLFMKGTARLPMCGFSATVAHILTKLEIPFKDINVLLNPELREGIKSFSDWPTIPQLYIKQEFIGGCDIVKEMFKSGEFYTLLEEKGIPYKPFES